VAAVVPGGAISTFAAIGHTAFRKAMALGANCVPIPTPLHCVERFASGTEPSPGVGLSRIQVANDNDFEVRTVGIDQVSILKER
jgi:hypothetical protein